ncbi:MAG: HNH endonuclease [Reichenbachiella sp.]|uniref:HNH endonuclease n=1 Tax=Reichenbachiella sp. TaxID=2184521 RepID=UPI0029664B67|nr:HNH endonuclease [Reichenbachiella sp.]MDW3210288.1 HNH endonuclease [Reichenbachiella sp.]
MINLEPYGEDCHEFHKTVVSKKYSKKSDPEYKERLNALDGQIEEVFEQYAELLNEDNLKSIAPYGYSGQQKTDLLSLYRYKSKILQELNVLLTTKDERKFNTCQMCTIEPVHSFDHIVPKEEFPEFVVNPINLLPCCFSCNGQKGDQWLIEGERAFLNLYYDILPEAQYLQVEFESYPIPIFSIDGSALDDNFSNLVQSHYENLDLFKRFRENSNEVIDPIVSSAKYTVPQLGIEKFKTIVEQSTNERRLKYGINHWKAILELELVNHDDFESLLA